jgi:hypothetical protein
MMIRRVVVNWQSSLQQAAEWLSSHYYAQLTGTEKSLVCRDEIVLHRLRAHNRIICMRYSRSCAVVDTRPYSAGRMWISASGPASPVLRWFGRRVGSLGPGLTSYSADAVSGCPAIDLSAGIPDFQAPTGVPV